jgi:GH25 family lysozyme M1 (1,4-beta-N-acetylmuramidase)
MTRGVNAGPPSVSWRVLRPAVTVVVGLVVLVGAAVPALAAQGIDVSSWNHPGGAPIDWPQVRSAGYSFAFVKADEGPQTPGGRYYVNPYWATDWAAAGAVGMYRGAYHFARPRLPISTAVADARHFVSITGTMRGPRDLPPVLDLEVDGGLRPADLNAWAAAWLAEVERLTGRRPIIYTGYYFWQDRMGATRQFAGYRLWLAQYNGKPAPDKVPSAWGAWSFWQYTSTGSVPGMVGNVDLNRYCCSEASLAALANGGAGDLAAGNPFGSLDGAQRLAGSIRVRGWAIDPDTTGPIPVHVYVDGRIAGTGTADAPRGDVGRAYPGWGAAHGFDLDVPVTPGDHTVCVYGINRGSGTVNPLLGCRLVTGDPFGALDEITPRPGGAVVTGWAVDPDTTSPIDVHVYVDGRGWAVGRADRHRPDVAQALSTGSAHGYAVPLAGLPPGTREVCTYGINVGSGANSLLGCRRVTLATGPFGALDDVVASDGGLRVRGWAIDPDTTSPIDVHVYVNGRLRAVHRAAAERPDVGVAFPGYGSAHGYDLTLFDLAEGANQICAYGINAGPGSANPLLGCRTVQVRGAVRGHLDAGTVVPGGVRVSGWAFDPDAPGPIDVHVYVDATGFVVRASLARPDVAAAVPGAPPATGFDAPIPVEPGVHQVCVYAPDVGPGLGNRLLGCRLLTV